MNISAHQAELTPEMIAAGADILKHELREDGRLIWDSAQATAAAIADEIRKPI